MRLLLDTHTLLWAMVDPGRLTEAALEVVRDGRHEVFASAASVWEIEIKRALGKLTAPDDLIDALIATGFRPLPISLEHARAAGVTAIASSRPVRPDADRPGADWNPSPS